jgi:hypothetical protein
MGLAICDMSASLDGYVTGPNDRRENPFGDGAGMLHDWLCTAATDQDCAILQDMSTPPAQSSCDARRSKRTKVTAAGGTTVRRMTRRSSWSRIARRRGRTRQCSHS